LNKQFFVKRSAGNHQNAMPNDGDGIESLRCNKYWREQDSNMPKWFVQDKQK